MSKTIAELRSDAERFLTAIWPALAQNAFSNTMVTHYMAAFAHYELQLQMEQDNAMDSGKGSRASETVAGRRVDDPDRM